MNKIRQKSDAVILALLCAAAYSSSAMANTADAAAQSHQSIRDAAGQHARAATAGLSARPDVTVGNLDSRLKLNPCDLPLESYDSPNGLNGGRGVVGVKCTGSKPWKIYVPVDVALMEKVVVARRPLVRGGTLRADDLMLQDMDTSRLHKAYFTRVEDAVGLISKRAVAGGATLHAGLLERATLVKRGNRVEIVAISDGLQVRMRGKALADGSRGDQVKVKNLNSGRVVSGIVADNGVIHVLH